MEKLKTVRFVDFEERSMKNLCNELNKFAAANPDVIYEVHHNTLLFEEKSFEYTALLVFKEAVHLNVWV